MVTGPRSDISMGFETRSRDTQPGTNSPDSFFSSGPQTSLCMGHGESHAEASGRHLGPTGDGGDPPSRAQSGVSLPCRVAGQEADGTGEWLRGGVGSGLCPDFPNMLYVLRQPLTLSQPQAF